MNSIDSWLQVRSDWSKKEISEIYNTPLLDLIYRASTVHRHYHKPNEVQVCTLLSIKTGRCPEDCSYCPQSAHYETEIKEHPLLMKEQVMEAAKRAKTAGSTRFCMGAAWREVKDNKDFDAVLEMVRGVAGMGLEVCCTLGMLSEEQAVKLKEAGVYAYNHNLDTSADFYKEIITTRTYADRLNTLKNVRNAGMTICCGGIIGLGESENDRIELLHTLATFEQHPESVPINALVSIQGTPLEEKTPIDTWSFVRMIATARALMPKSMVRLSAGRLELSKEAQALCFLAGANSVFSGEKLLTTPNPTADEDNLMFKLFGLHARAPYQPALLAT